MSRENLPFKAPSAACEAHSNSAMLSKKKRLIIEVSALIPRSAERRSQRASSVTSDFSARAASRRSRCGISLEARWPPCPTGSREPSRSTRSSHLIATNSLISYRRAAARRLISPLAAALLATLLFLAPQISTTKAPLPRLLNWSTQAGEFWDCERAKSESILPYARRGPCRSRVCQSLAYHFFSGQPSPSPLTEDASAISAITRGLWAADRC